MLLRPRPRGPPRTVATGSVRSTYTPEVSRLRTTLTVLGVATASMFLGACSSPQEAALPSPARQAAAQACPDLGGPIDMPSYFDFNTKFGINVTIENGTSRGWRVEVPPVDCFDFSGVNNPTRYNGAVVPAQSSSGPHQVVARRVCSWVSGGTIGYFQTREAKWTTTFVDDSSGTRFSVPSIIACNTFDKSSPTMCLSGVRQDSDVRIFDMTDGGAMRVVTTCSESKTSIRLEQLY